MIIILQSNNRKCYLYLKTLKLLSINKYYMTVKALKVQCFGWIHLAGKTPVVASI